MENINPVVPNVPPVEEKKSRRFSPKIVAGLVTAAAAAGVAIVVHKLKGDDGSPLENVITEVFPPT